MFGLSKRARSRDKWRTEPILRTHQGHLLPIPDLIALTDEVIYRAGVPDVDPARVQGTMMQDIENRCSELLARHVNAGAAAGMTMLKERDDFHSDMLFNYLSMHGPSGIVIHNKVVEYLTNEQFAMDFAEILQENDDLR
jgi:hypothetical protein